MDLLPLGDGQLLQGTESAFQAESLSGHGGTLRDDQVGSELARRAALGLGREDDTEVLAALAEVVPQRSVQQYQERPPWGSALIRLINVAREALTDQQWFVLRSRLDQTLGQVGDQLGVSRERARQIESDARLILFRILDSESVVMQGWRAALDCPAVSEATLLEDRIDSASATNEQITMARVAFRALGAVRPRRFDRRVLDGFWTLHPERLNEALKRLALTAPCEDDELMGAFASSELDASLPFSVLLRDHGSPVSHHSGVGGWVRAVARDRDAAWLALRRRGSPLGAADLAKATKCPRHNLEESVRRDDRFVKLNPSGLWAIVEWNLPESEYATTMDAVIGVLTEMGPMPLAQLARNVTARYPVTLGAVNQCMVHEAIGRWPDGRIDLSARGAPHLQESEPRLPPEIFIEEAGEVLAIRKEVTPDLLRGSGLGLHRYISWALGMYRAPQERYFDAPNGTKITVRRRVHGTSISSLRAWAADLGAQLGCTLIVRLNKSDETAAVYLGCLGPCVHRPGASLSALP